MNFKKIPALVNIKLMHYTCVGIKNAEVLTEVSNKVCSWNMEVCLKFRNDCCVGKLTLMNWCCLSCLLVFVLCAGCTVNKASYSFLKTDSAPMETVLPLQLSNRVNMYWEYRSAKNYKASYKIEAFHTRYQIGYDKYLKLLERGRPITAVELLNVDCNENRCILILDLQFVGLDKKSQKIKDYWILQDGEWYHVIRDIFRKIY